MDRWNYVVWLLDAAMFALFAVGYFQFTRRANKIPVPDLSESDLFHESPQIFLDTLVLAQERLNERLVLRQRGLRLFYVAMAVGLVAVAVSLVHLVWVLVDLT